MSRTPRFCPDWKSTAEISAGVREIVAAQPEFFTETGDGWPVVFQRQEAAGFRVVCEDKAVRIFYARPCDAYRALAALMAADARAGLEIAEASPFTSIGVMLDVSRNGVFTLAALKTLFRRFAMMGINAIQLYTEDTYEIPGEPFFGYFRGRYSAEELRAIDDLGAFWGIEVIPCIQTLAHLEQILQWPAYAEIMDVPSVILAEEPKSYALVGKMLDTASACFRSRRVHIGMDEAHGIGLGRYRLKHGDRPSFDILNHHLQKVAALCRDRGLEPMIWSDMYFRLGSTINDYYDPALVVPPEVAKAIPAEVELVYWDYYHKEPGFYLDWIDRHRAMGKEPVLAVGAWTWNRLWAGIPYAATTMGAGLRAAREKGLREVLMTVWGDDGMECNFASALPTIQHFAEVAYTGDTKHLAARFHITCQADYDAYLLACEADSVPELGPPGEICANTAKWILWHDPILGFLNAHISPHLPEHYRGLAKKLADQNDPHLEYMRHLCEALEHKCVLHLKTRTACANHDLATITKLIETHLPATETAIQNAWQAHREIWRLFYKPPGWDVIERRYAGIIARLQSLGRLLEEFRKNPSTLPAEFADEPLPVFPEKEKPQLMPLHARSSAASVIH